ncbi:hypothetical protein HC931_21600 [Candidatus Gracilibacteria bacterium]|nr:hypothetical protein [Candidatus Gracilibacteria bacterium]
MNFSNDQPPNANNRQKKRLLVVDEQTKGSQAQKNQPWSKIEKAVETVDENKRSVTEKNTILLGTQGSCEQFSGCLWE